MPPGLRAKNSSLDLFCVAVQAQPQSPKQPALLKSKVNYSEQAYTLAGYFTSVSQANLFSAHLVRSELTISHGVAMPKVEIPAQPCPKQWQNSVTLVGQEVS